MLAKAGKTEQADALLAGAEEQTEDPRVLHQLALTLQMRGELGRAMAVLEKASARAPEHVLIRLQLATLQALAGKTDAARVHAEKLLQLAPDSSGGPLLLAALAAKPAEVDAAIGHLERWRASARRALHEHDGLEALLTLQALYLQGGRADAAAKLEPAIERAKLTNPPGALYLAQIQLRSGRRALAERLLQAAGEADATLPVWETLAAVSADLAHPDAAERALDHLDATSRARPRNQVVWGAVLLLRGRTAEAIDVLRAAQAGLGEAQRHGRVALLLAQAFARTGELPKATATLRAAEAAGKLTPEGRYLLSETLRKAGDHAGAVAALTPLLKLPDERDEAYDRLVMLRTQAGELEAARGLVDAWSKLAPSSPGPQIALAGVQLKAGAPAEADKTLRAVLAAHPGTVRALDPLAALLLQQGEAKAAEALVAAQLAEVRSPEMLDYAGAFLEGRGRHAEAEKLFRELLALDRSAPAPWARLARLKRAQGRKTQALELYQQALALAPADLELALEAAPLEAEAGQTAQAIRHYEQVLAGGVQDAGVMNNLALLYADAGQQLDRALQLAEDARRRLPEVPQVLDTLAWVHHRRGESAQALPLLQQAVQALPDRASVALHLGMVQLATGDAEAGTASLKRALRLDPELPEARAARDAIAAAEAG